MWLQFNIFNTEIRSSDRTSEQRERTQQRNEHRTNESNGQRLNGITPNWNGDSLARRGTASVTVNVVFR